MEKLTEKVDSIQHSNKKVRRRWQGKLNRCKVELSRGMRRLPWLPSRWKQFAKGIDHAVEQLIHLESDLRKLEGRTGIPAHARIRELRREIRKLEAAAAPSLVHLKHPMSV